MIIKISKYLIIFCVIFFIKSPIYGQIGYQQKGLASYYHDKFAGRRTSSGERFSQNKFTGAHRKFLFNTMVRVTNLKNDKSIIVRINDRGPYKYANRIIDLTLQAADAIGMTNKGIVPVKVEVVGEDGKINFKSKSVFPGSFEPGNCYNYRGEERFPKGYGVQVAAFSDLANAKYFAKALFKEGFREIVIKVTPHFGDTLGFKIVVGEFSKIENARKYISKLEIKDFIGFTTKY